MVRWRLTLAACAAVLGMTGSCGRENDAAEHMEMSDSMLAVRAMGDDAIRDSMLDIMPGGEMARGDSIAARRLLDAKR